MTPTPPDGKLECDHFDKDHHPVYWNPFNKVVQCHKCGEQFVPISRAPSRDPEVAGLKAEIDLWKENHDGMTKSSIIWESRFNAERETVEKLKAELDLQQGAIDILHTTRDNLWKSRDAEREASRKLFRTIAFFASVIKSGEPWTEHCETAYREAVKVATPGHSPEGKTL